MEFKVKLIFLKLNILFYPFWVYKFSTQYNTESVRPANCGWTAFKDRVTSVGIKIAHYRRDFTVTLTSTLD